MGDKVSLVNFENIIHPSRAANLAPSSPLMPPLSLTLARPMKINKQSRKRESQKSLAFLLSI